MEKQIILDTNFLIYCAEYKIDLFTEIDRLCDFPYKIGVLSRTIEELESLNPKKLYIIKLFLKKIDVIKSKEHYVDDELAELSKNAIIATQDKELKKRCKSKIIIIRQKSYLELKLYNSI